MPIWDFKCEVCGWIEERLALKESEKLPCKCGGNMIKIFTPSIPHIMVSRFIYDPIGDIAEQYGKEPDKLPREKELEETTGDFFTKGDMTPTKQKTYSTPNNPTKDKRFWRKKISS